MSEARCGGGAGATLIETITGAMMPVALWSAPRLWPSSCAARMRSTESELPRPWVTAKA